MPLLCGYLCLISRSLGSWWLVLGAFRDFWYFALVATRMCIDCTVWIALCTFLYKGMSLMYMLKRVGPRIDLCETPDRINLGVDEWGSFTLFWLFQLGCVLLLILGWFYCTKPCRVLSFLCTSRIMCSLILNNWFIVAWPVLKSNYSFTIVFCFWGWLWRYMRVITSKSLLNKLNRSVCSW